MSIIVNLTDARRLASLAFVGAILLPLSAQATPRDTPADLTFASGAIGSVAPECGVGDQCATLKLPTGDEIRVYNGGASHCKPYDLQILRVHGETVLFTSHSETNKQPDTEGLFGDTRCGGYKDTFLMFDAGRARLGIHQSQDGALYAEWLSTKGTASASASGWRPQPGDEVAPNPLRIEADYSKEMKDGHPAFCHADAQMWMPWTNLKCKNYRVEWYREQNASDPFDHE